MNTLANNFPALLAFARTVSAGSLSSAARELDVPVSVVSRRLAQLETSLGTRLLQRTTRRQTLTEEGRLLHARVLPDYAIAAAPLHAVYPHQRNLAPRVRLFVDYLKDSLRAAWRW